MVPTASAVAPLPDDVHRGDLLTAVSPAGFPLSSSLAGLFPGGELRRGSVLCVANSTFLTIALLAAVSRHGGWCAEVGVPLVGTAAAAELGVELERFVRLPRAGDRWPEVTAALLEGFDLVVVHPPGRTA
ncbi:MAG: hypothetical protein IRZ02_08665, partial [Acidothermus sp.]|nr:hypothetical protein [Acidothermus sp.]